MTPEFASHRPIAESSPSAFRPPPSAFRSGSLLLVAVSLGLHLAALVRAEPLQSANDRSRWATVRALSERGDFAIDPYEFEKRWATIDQVQVGGRLYSTKPALLPLAVTAVYLPVSALTGWYLAIDPAPATRWTLLVVNLLPFAAALLVVRNLLTDFARTDFARFLALGTLGFGTFLSAFLPTLNNHTAAGCCAALALCPLVRIHVGDRTSWRFAAAGFFASLTVTNELPAGLFALLALAVCGKADWRRTLLWFVPAAVVPAAAFVAATWAQTGGPLPFYLRYGGEAYEFVRNGRPSYWTNPTGLDANPDGFWAYLFHCTLGHHGLFSLTPVWLLSAWAGVASLPALVRHPPQADDSSSRSAVPPHPLAACAAATWLLTAAVFGFYLSRTQNYNYGGTSVALRWLVWLSPLWAASLAPLADRFAGRDWFVGLAAALLGLSAASAWWSSPSPWRHPWLYDLGGYAEEHAAAASPPKTSPGREPAAVAAGPAGAYFGRPGRPCGRRLKA